MQHNTKKTGLSQICYQDMIANYATTLIFVLTKLTITFVKFSKALSAATARKLKPDLMPC